MSGTSYFGGLGFEGRVTSKLQGLAYHFYYKLRSQFNYERIFLELKQKILWNIHPLQSKVL